MENYVIPIAVGCCDGNGVVVGDLLMTAGHVVNKGDTIHINIKGDTYSLNKNDAIVCLEEKSNEEGLFNDCAVYKLNNRYNHLTIENYIPTVGDILQSVSYKHIVEKQTADCVGFWGTQYKESYELCTLRATVVDIIGNFIICEMNEPLEEGRSGSPLICGDKVVGILHGGIEGKICVFQSIASIQQKILQNQS
ncbi:MAG: trypsin-like serine protease [Alistipes sp.]|nr:trypsin-like serine protease [Alistipes sp.]